MEPFESTASTSAALDSSVQASVMGIRGIIVPSASEMEALCARWAANFSASSTLSSTFDFAASNFAQRPSHFLVWTLGLSFVTIISLCALVGIFVMKFLKQSIFNKFITFFVSVGVGSLSGSAVFHLLPQAFGLVDEFNPNANHLYLSRAFAAIVGIYLFFFSDKVIKIILETKKRKQMKATELAQLNFFADRYRSDNSNKHFVENEKFDHHHDNKEEGIDFSSSKAVIAAGASIVNEHSNQSSDALLIISTNEKVVKKPDLKEDQKLMKTNSESDDQYNRQAHSLCIHDHDVQYKEGDSVIATVAWMIIFGDGLHNFIDGISIGASFSESILSGLSVSLAVICEEFPHELGDVAILVSAGMTLRQALVYNLLSALTCYFGFAIGVLVGNLDDSFASYTFGFAGGMFLYISMACMMPEMKNAMEEALSISLSAGLEVLVIQALGVTCGLSTMALMARFGGEIALHS